MRSLSLLAAALLQGLWIAHAQQDQSQQSANSSAKPEVLIHSDSDFCLFLPPQPGLDVATNEDNGIPFCTNPDNVPGSKPFPEGFITTAHYQKNDTYEQITGYIDASKYQLQPTDGGGQYDSHGDGKPKGASCQNYDYFVSLIEPSDNRFCIRCCKNENDCPTGRSGYGCLRVVPGDYSGAPNGGDQQQSGDGQQQQPGDGQQQPTDGQQQPDDGQQQPTDGQQQPTDGQQQPTDGQQQPTDGQQQPTDGQQQPTDGQQQPTTGQEQPGAGGDQQQQASDPSGQSSPGDQSQVQPQVQSQVQSTSPAEIQSSHPNTAFASVLDGMDQPGFDNNSSSNNQSSASSSKQNIMDSFPAEIQSLETQLSSPQANLEQVKSQWTSFTDGLAKQFPSAASALDKLKHYPDDYSTADEWNQFLSSLKTKVTNTTDQSSSGASSASSLPSASLPPTASDANQYQATW